MKPQSLFDEQQLVPALRGAVRKLHPAALAKNPVIFITALVAVLATVLCARDALTGAPDVAFSTQVVVWL